MISCIILEDEPYAQKLLEKYIGRIPELNLRGTFSDPQMAKEFLSQQQVDLLFLDIEMPGMNGMDLCLLLPPTTSVIFTTAYAEYAVESYNKGAIDYLLKPLHFERLLTAVDKVVKQKQLTKDKQGSNVPEFLFIKEGRQYHQLNINDIYFIKGLKDYVEFRTKAHRYIVLDNLKRLEQSLPPGFLRIHYSYIVNYAKIISFGSKHVIILETDIPVSKKYQEKLAGLVKRDLL